MIYIFETAQVIKKKNGREKIKNVPQGILKRFAKKKEKVQLKKHIFKCIKKSQRRNKKGALGLVKGFLY